MRTEINVFLKEKELHLLPEIVKIWNSTGFILTDTVILPRSAEYMYTFERKEDLKN